MSDVINMTLKVASKLNQRSVVRYVEQFKSSGSTATPFVVELDPTTACNLACPDCINRSLLNQGYFTRKRIRELAREMVDAGVKAVVLIGGGEPLAHPEAGWLIEFLAKNSVQVGITTNGTLMHRYLDVIAEHASWVRVSMDSGGEDVYRRIRPSVSGHAAFDDAIHNMEQLAKIKKGKLGYSFMLYAEGLFNATVDEDGRSKPLDSTPAEDAGERFNNIGDILKAGQLAKRIGCDYYEVKPMYDMNHYAVLFGKALMVEAQEQVRMVQELSDDTFKVLLATKLKHVLNGEDNIEKKEYHRCAAAHMRTLVTPSGVYVCPYFRGRDDMRVGEVVKTPFKGMWTGETRAKVIERLDPTIHCKMHCIRHDFNHNVEAMLSSTSKPAFIEDYDLFI